MRREEKIFPPLFLSRSPCRGAVFFVAFVVSSQRAMEYVFLYDYEIILAVFLRITYINVIIFYRTNI